MIKVGIVGGTGYTGVELLRILANHPDADVVAITSRAWGSQKQDHPQSQKLELHIAPFLKVRFALKISENMPICQ